MTGGLKMGVNVAAHTRHIFLGSAPPGVCPVDLSLRNLGVINHFRWLKMAYRILRLYVARVNPSDELKTLVSFMTSLCLHVVWNNTAPSCKDGVRHVYNTILKSRYLEDDLKNVVDPVIQRNAFFSHPENLLLAMLTDERQAIRKSSLIAMTCIIKTWTWWRRGTETGICSFISMSHPGGWETYQASDRGISISILFQKVTTDSLEHAWNQDRKCQTLKANIVCYSDIKALFF